MWRERVGKRLLATSRLAPLGVGTALYGRAGAGTLHERHANQEIRKCRLNTTGTAALRIYIFLTAYSWQQACATWYCQLYAPYHGCW